jgi:hypothetical protein
MTYKLGLKIGLGFGFIAWLVFHGYVTFTPTLEIVKNLVVFLVAYLFVVSVILGILWGVRGKATLGTTGDGFVYGFMAIFDILYVLTQLYLGKLPLP